MTALFFTAHVCNEQCKDDCPDLDGRARSNLDRMRRAKRICASCPVLAECRAWILANPNECPWGVVGGMSESERKRHTWAPPKKKKRAVA